jgi:hypothetical protein
MAPDLHLKVEKRRSRHFVLSLPRCSPGRELPSLLSMKPKIRDPKEWYSPSKLHSSFFKTEQGSLRERAPWKYSFQVEKFLLLLFCSSYWICTEITIF